MGRLEGNVAVITGGASGIGEATVRLFAGEGARVVIADIQDEAGERLASALGGSAVYQRTDVAREDDIRAAIQRATKEFGRLDCIFNNAGIGGAVGPIEDIPIDEYDRTMDVLLRSVFLGIKHAAPVMKSQGSGSIISTASIAGLRAGEGPHVYSAAKAAVIHLTRSAALELAAHNVRVNCICPGAIVTPLVTMGLAPATPEFLDAMKASLARYQPLPRAGMPEDIAQAALWLAGDDAPFVTGHALVVDGGLTAGRPWEQQPETFRVRRAMK
jgi:NAD(P)-dependent dehydrogenase (short-subunit alcohol dehydrogenase family)